MGSPDRGVSCAGKIKSSLRDLHYAASMRKGASAPLHPPLHATQRGQAKFTQFGDEQARIAGKDYASP